MNTTKVIDHLYLKHPVYYAFFNSSTGSVKRTLTLTHSTFGLKTGGFEANRLGRPSR